MVTYIRDNPRQVICFMIVMDDEGAEVGGGYHPACAMAILPAKASNFELTFLSHHNSIISINSIIVLEPKNL